MFVGCESVVDSSDDDAVMVLSLACITCSQFSSALFAADAFDALPSALSSFLIMFSVFILASCSLLLVIPSSSLFVLLLSMLSLSFVVSFPSLFVLFSSRFLNMLSLFILVSSSSLFILFISIFSLLFVVSSCSSLFVLFSSLLLNMLSLFSLASCSLFILFLSIFSVFICSLLLLPAFFNSVVVKNGWPYSVLPVFLVLDEF